MSEANETNEPQASTDPVSLAAKAVSGAVTPLLQDHDPRALMIGLLMNAVKLAAQILKAKRWTVQQVVTEFSQALCATLEPEQPQEKSRIQVVDATGRPR